MKISEASVLVVEDDKFMMALVVNALQRLGVCKVHQAHGGKTGLMMLENHRPDLVLSGIHMEPMNGLEFIRSIRAHTLHEMRKLPVLMMSVDSTTGTLNQTAPLHIAGYIIKPPTMSNLKVKLEHALKCDDAERFGQLVASTG
jgi:CheY-like chemotaxis protein